MALYLFVAGVAALGRQITPFPKPVEQGSVKRSGAYGLVRHPMYGGVLLLTLAWSLVSSPLALGRRLRPRQGGELSRSVPTVRRAPHRENSGVPA